MTLVLRNLPVLSMCWICPNSAIFSSLLELCEHARQRHYFIFPIYTCHFCPTTYFGTWDQFLRHVAGPRHYNTTVNIMLHSYRLLVDPKGRTVLRFGA